VVGTTDQDGARAQGARVGGIAQRRQDPADLPVDHPVEVRVEVDVVQLLATIAERAHVGRHPHLHEGVDSGLARQVLVNGGRQPNPQLAELLHRVSAALERGRIAEHIVRIDQRDDQAEGLGQVLASEPLLDLAGVDLVPALALSGVAAAEVLGLRVLPRVGRLPVGEAILLGEPVLVRRTPAPE
jgi:hypothetical protein